MSGINPCGKTFTGYLCGGLMPQIGGVQICPWCQLKKSKEREAVLIEAMTNSIGILCADKRLNEALEKIKGMK